MVWPLLNKPQNDQAALYLFHKNLLCWELQSLWTVWKQKLLVGACTVPLLNNSLPLQPCSKNCPSCPNSLSYVGLLRENPMVQLYSWHFFFCLCFCFILVNEWKVSYVLYLSIVFLVDLLLSLTFPPDVFQYLFEQSCSGWSHRCLLFKL